MFNTTVGVRLVRTDLSLQLSNLLRVVLSLLLYLLFELLVLFLQPLIVVRHNHRHLIAHNSFTAFVQRLLFRAPMCLASSCVVA